MMTSSRPTEHHHHPVVSALDELIAAYDRAIGVFRDNHLQSEIDALLPDRELLVVLRSRLGFLGKRDGR